MSYVDIVLLVVICISAFFALWRGIIAEILSLVGVAVAFVAAQSWAQVFAEIIEIENSYSFLVIFTSILLLSRIIISIFQIVIPKKARILAMIISLPKTIIIWIVYLPFVQLTSLPDDRMWQQSQFIPHLKQIKDKINLENKMGDIVVQSVWNLKSIEENLENSKSLIKRRAQKLKEQ